MPYQKYAELGPGPPLTYAPGAVATLSLGECYPTGKQPILGQFSSPQLLVLRDSAEQRAARSQVFEWNT